MQLMLRGTRYLVPRLGTRRLVLGTAAAATCSRENTNRRQTVQRGTIWTADAHRSDGKRFVVRADDKLRTFLELESAAAIQLVRLPWRQG